MNWFCRITFCLLTATLFLVPAHAQGTSEIQSSTFTDNLSSEDEIKWYPFEMEEEGDVFIQVQGLLDRLDGRYYWRCMVLEADQETVLADLSVLGRSEFYGPDRVALPNLSAGTYYIRMSSIAFANPLLSTFTTDNYELKLVQVSNSAQPVYDGDGVQTFSKAGEILWSKNGTVFVKCNDGVCYGALTRDSDGTIIPVLISEEPDAVEYFVSETGEIVGAGNSPWTQKRTNTDYYISERGYKGNSSQKSSSEKNLPIFYVEKSGAYAAEKIMDKLGEGEYGELQYLWMKHKEAILAIGGGLIMLFLYIAFFSYFAPNSGGSDDIDLDGGSPHEHGLAMMHNVLDDDNDSSGGCDW